MVFGDNIRDGRGDIEFDIDAFIDAVLSTLTRPIDMTLGQLHGVVGSLQPLVQEAPIKQLRMRQVEVALAEQEMEHIPLSGVLGLIDGTGEAAMSAQAHEDVFDNLPLKRVLSTLGGRPTRLRTPDLIGLTTLATKLVRSHDVLEDLTVAELTSHVSPHMLRLLTIQELREVLERSSAVIAKAGAFHAAQHLP